MLCTSKKSYCFAVEQMASVKLASLITLKLSLSRLSQQNGCIYYGDMSDIAN